MLRAAAHAPQLSRSRARMLPLKPMLCDKKSHRSEKPRAPQPDSSPRLPQREKAAGDEGAKHSQA